MNIFVLRNIFKCKAIETGMILLIRDMKKYLYPILTFLDKWCHKIVNSIDQNFRQQ